MLLAAVAHEARLSAPADPTQPGGPTVRAHITAAVRMGRLPASALDGPEAPESHAYLLGWYSEIARGRTFAMHGPNPITYEGIEAWARLTGQAPEPHEVEALLALDLVARHPDVLAEAD